MHELSESAMAILCHSIAATTWLSARPDPVALLFGPITVEARSSGEVRGLGLFTTRNIPAYSEILREAPTVLLEPTDGLPQLYEQFISLREPGSDALQQKYLALSRHEVPERDTRLREKLRERGFDEASVEEMVKVANIMQTNAFNVDLGNGKGRNHRALFAQIARINHSCAPNAHVCFYPSMHEDTPGRMVVHALRDLQAGEEVLIAYFSILLSRPERQTKAQKWGFTCGCSACDSRDGSVHEQLRKAVLDFTTEQKALMQNRRLALKQITDLIAIGCSTIDKVIDKGGLRPAIPDLYENLGMLRAKALLLQRRDNQHEGVVEFLKLAAVWEAKLTGMGSPATKKRLHKLEQFATQKNTFGSPCIVAAGLGEYAIEWVAT